MVVFILGYCLTYRSNKLLLEIKSTLSKENFSNLMFNFHGFRWVAENNWEIPEKLHSHLWNWISENWSIFHNYDLTLLLQYPYGFILPSETSKFVTNSFLDQHSTVSSFDVNVRGEFSWKELFLLFCEQ